MFSLKEIERKGRRLPGYDYAKPGAYFITIVTQDRNYHFGAGVDVPVDPSKIAIVQLSEFGQMVDECWRSIPNKFPRVRLDKFVVMPNHIHGIIEIMDLAANESGSTGTSTPATDIPSVMRWFKSWTTSLFIKFHHDRLKMFDRRLWQRKYHDWIIRDSASLERMRRYIINNPKNWFADRNR